MKKLLMLAVALGAFAIPASASADPTPNGHFLHEGEPISGVVTANLTGTAQFVIAAAPTEGVHCTTVHFGVNLETTHGEVHSFVPTGCTTKAADPAKNGLPIDPTKIGTWTVEPNLATSQIWITGLHINSKVTHPLTTHLVVSESTFKGGTVIATIPPGETPAIETVTLSDIGATWEVGLPPGEPVFTVNMSGHLTSNGTVGIGAGEEE